MYNTHIKAFVHSAKCRPQTNESIRFDMRHVYIVKATQIYCNIISQLIEMLNAIDIICRENVNIRGMCLKLEIEIFSAFRVSTYDSMGIFFSCSLSSRFSSLFLLSNENRMRCVERSRRRKNNKRNPTHPFFTTHFCHIRSARILFTPPQFICVSICFFFVYFYFLFPHVNHMTYISIVRGIFVAKSRFQEK